LIAYVSFELILIIVSLLWLIPLGSVKGVFFWLIDVVPARGADQIEAREIAEKGRIVWLAKKLNSDIENWTYDDTKDFVSLLNWRARLLFDARKRFEQRLRILIEYKEDTGREPGSLTSKETKELLGHLDPGWFETLIVNNHYFNALTGLMIIVVILNAWR
jgi:hypothetical protein